MNRLKLGTGILSLLLEKYDGGPGMDTSRVLLRMHLYNPENRGMGVSVN
jgi:hypothetical protein